MKPLITIATVTYNAEATLRRTLTSVASQDYARIEHLIIDGCSTDHTLSLVQRYVEENQSRHNIRLICEPDSGLYDAMNKALLAATGEYIVFLNAGDCLHSTDTISAIVQQTQWMKGGHRHPAILYGDTHIVYQLPDNDSVNELSIEPLGKFATRKFKLTTTLEDGEAGIDLKFLVHVHEGLGQAGHLQQHGGAVALGGVNTGLVLTDYLNEGMTTSNQRASLIERFRIMAHYYGWLPTVMRHFWFIIRAIIKR